MASTIGCELMQSFYAEPFEREMGGTEATLPNATGVQYGMLQVCELAKAHWA